MSTNCIACVRNERTGPDLLCDACRERRKSGRRPQGFATMDPARRKQIASLGGQVSQAGGTAHRWDRDVEGAREAGRKGGTNLFIKRGPEHFAAMGRKGGLAKGIKKKDA